MRFIDTIKSFLFDKEEYLTFFNNHAHIFGIESIISLTENLVIVKTKKTIVKIKGKNLKILKMTKEELLIEGSFESVLFHD